MLYLHDLAKQNQQVQTVSLNERLPSFIIPPCSVQIAYSVQAEHDFYLLQLHVQGKLHSVCQRCLGEFDSHYDNSTQIAVCSTDARAEKLLEHYECIVAPNMKIDLYELVTDELHLYALQFHPDSKDCDSAAQAILKGEADN